jgi:hypothetical protein
MKEWLSVEPAFEDQWLTLATAACQFVGSRR